MLRKIALLLVFATTAASSALAQQQMHEYNVGDFNSLRVVDGIDVEYVASKDSAGIIRFIATDEVAHKVLFSNKQSKNGGKLSIQVSTDVLTGATPVQLPKIKVFSSHLDEIANGGDSTITITLQGTREPEFKAIISNNGKIIIRGLQASTAMLSIVTGHGHIEASGDECEQLSLRILGKGEINAIRLPGKEINCRLMGTGNIYCNSTGGELKVRSTGSGKVLYKGKPSKVSVKKLGSIKVESTQ